MRKEWFGVVLLSCLASSCSGSAQRGPREAIFREVIAGVPDYRGFLTVDELHASLRDIEEKYPDVVSLNLLGETDGRNPIYELLVGRGRNHALLFGFPHPNEPIGSMMLHYLSRELAENQALRESLDFTWHIVICADPDKAKLNEGWFKGPLTLTKYARHFYRPPSYQQVEWTFPVAYKAYTFDTPTPEARALMKVIDSNPIRFSFGLHNSAFGGVYHYWSHDVPELYPVLYDFIESQRLPLHLGEPEVPWGKKFDDRSMFRMLYFTEDYDYLEKFSPVPPQELLRSGASSDDYIKEKYGALTVNCELPYFYDPKIEDTSPSDTTRRQAVLEAIEDERELLGAFKRWYEEARPLLTVRSLFVDAIEEHLRTGDANLATMEKGVQTEKEYERVATNAEKWDALSLRKFYGLLNLGQFIRLLEHEKREAGEKFPSALQEILDESLQEFEKQAAEAETAFDYSVIPIKKLASVQLVTALYAMDYVERHPEIEDRR